MPLVLAGLVLLGVGTFFAQAAATGCVGRTAMTDRAAASGLYLACYYVGGLSGEAIIGQIFDRLGWGLLVFGLAAALGLAALLTVQLREPRRAFGKETAVTIKIDCRKLGQIVLVLQGGGALGAYQAGVYQALHEADIEPDWVIGTSIGAINAALIAGNAPGQRLAKLQEFWSRITQNSLLAAANANPFIAAFTPNAATIAGGVPGFFEPNPAAWIGTKARLGAEQAAYYSTEPLQSTLLDLTSPELLNAGSPRLTVGAANIQTGEMHYFDSRETTLSIRHIMASGALPPAFPAIRIHGELYWDGGILSNTPVEAVFDDIPRRSGLIFAVHMWGPHGPEPDSIWSVLGRQKDLQYASRAVSHIRRQKQIHKLRHIIAELAEKLPAEARADPEIAAMAAHGCTTRMHVVRLLAPPLAGEDHSKDIDFSAKGIRARWKAGCVDTKRALTEMPWNHEFGRTEGFILHEAHAGRVMAGDDIRGVLSVESS